MMENNITTMNVFGVPIVKEINAYAPTETEIEYISGLEYTESDDLSEKISIGGYLIDGAPELASMKKMFDEKANNFMVNTLEIKNKVKLTQSWSTLNKENSTHHPHAHPGCFITLIFYLHGDSGDLQIEKESALVCGYNFDYDIIEYNPFNSNCWTIPFEKNSLVIFPGWIIHSTLPNESKTDRVTVVGNYFLTGPIGRKSQVTYLDIKIE